MTANLLRTTPVFRTTPALRTTTAALAIAAGLGLTAAASPAQADEAQAATGEEVPQAEIEAARGLVKGFFTELKGELQSAIKEGGPAHAIGVCQEVAPSIAGKMSENSGWSVGRTALKVRNPRNTPSVRERAVLMEFKQRHAEGESFKTMESATVVEEGDRRYLHYMKAIPTQQVCLACHGSNVKKPVEEAIAAQYPADAATGFEKGELRGAFTFVKPLTAE
jgi:cytochrome c551/c552